MCIRDRDLYGQRVAEDGTLVGDNTLWASAVSWIAGLAAAAHASVPQLLAVWEWDGEIYAQRYGIPAANFTATPRWGSAPLTVTFSNLSGPADEITGYLWDFGDGATSTAISPTHTYSNTPGSPIAAYTVTLTVTGTAGSHVRVRPAYIAVNTPFTPAVDLRGHWRLDEATGTRYDESAYTNHLTPTGPVNRVLAIRGDAVDLEADNATYLSISDAQQQGLAITPAA